MKRIITLLLVCIFLFSCNNKKIDSENKSYKQKIDSLKKENDALKTTITKKPSINLNFVKTYEGKIDNKHEYLVKVNSNDGKIEGTYFYKSKCKNITIKGHVKKDSTFIIKEYAFGINNIPSGHFVGKIINKNKLDGNWSERPSSKKYPFYFIETNENYFNALQNCKTINESKRLKTLIIDEVSLTKYPLTKSSGSSWDKLTGSYKPDIFIKVSPNNDRNNFVYNNSNKRHHNVEEKQLPLNFNSLNIKLTKEQYKDGVLIQFFDLDINLDDLMGTVKIENLKGSFEGNRITVFKESKSTKAQITYHFEK